MIHIRITSPPVPTPQGVIKANGKTRSSRCPQSSIWSSSRKKDEFEQAESKLMCSHFSFSRGCPALLAYAGLHQGSQCDTAATTAAIAATAMSAVVALSTAAAAAVVVVVFVESASVAELAPVVELAAFVEAGAFVVEASAFFAVTFISLLITLDLSFLVPFVALWEPADAEPKTQRRRATRMSLETFIFF